jgi:putative ABC transport system ATP-binding protein
VEAGQDDGDVPVVELVGVSRSFPGPPVVHAVRGVDLVIRRGDYVSIAGPSGSGKSTLLHLMGMLDRPTAGTYRLDGVDTQAMAERERAAWRGRRIGFVFQAFHLLGQRSVAENVELAMTYTGVPRGRRAERALAALDRVGLGHRVAFSPATLSGGERQRVAIARALVGGPSLLLADEPTGNLDSATAASILDLFGDLHRDGLTLAVVTHDEAVSRRAERQVRTIDGSVREGA